jgi:glycosyltransferase involved in cell wall biosynthesis
LAAGHRLLLVAPDSEGPNPYAGNPHRREIRLPSVAIKGMQFRLAVGQDFDYRLAQIIANPPDVIHVHGFGPVCLLGLWAAQRAGRPLVISWQTDLEAYAEHYWHLLPLLNAAYKVYHAHLTKSWPQLRNLRVKRPRRGGAQVQLLQLAASMLTSADLVIAPSAKTARRVLEVAPQAKVRVVPTGADPLPPLAPVPKGDGPRLLYVGRISAEKGIDLLLDAFELVRDAIPQAELMLVGDWRAASVALRARLRQAANFGRVRLMGQVRHEELGAYLAGADVFVFPSMTDTQGIVLHDAANAGLPLVMCDDELRLVADPGVNAFLARPNPISLAQTIISTLDSLRNPEFAARAAARSKELGAQYPIAGQAEQILEIYRQLAGGQPVEPTPGLEAAVGRRVFPGRRVNAEYSVPGS